VLAVPWDRGPPGSLVGAMANLVAGVGRHCGDATAKAGPGGPRSQGDSRLLSTRSAGLQARSLAPWRTWSPGSAVFVVMLTTKAGPGGPRSQGGQPTAFHTERGPPGPLVGTMANLVTRVDRLCGDADNQGRAWRPAVPGGQPTAGPWDRGPPGPLVVFGDSRLLSTRRPLPGRPLTSY